MGWIDAVLDNRITGWGAFGILAGFVIFLLLTDKLVSRRRIAEAVAAEQRMTEHFHEMWQIADKRGDVMETVAEDVVVVGESLNRLLKALPVPKEK